MHNHWIGAMVNVSGDAMHENACSVTLQAATLCTKC